jgi:hypothetical protein
VSAPFPPPPAVDLLAQAAERVRPALMDQSKPTKGRVRILWAAASSACDLGALDVVFGEFMQAAVDANLIDRRAEDIEHVLRWALRGWNPFEKGPLK